MAESLQALEPEPASDLSYILAEVVDRLVTQIVGEVTIDRATLLDRIHNVAEMITEETGPMRLRMHPADVELLADADIPLPRHSDAHLVRGTVILETGEGTIEDGPEIRLAKMRSALDRMGIGR